MIDAKKYALVDLHLHLDGSISKESAKVLAKMQGIELCSDEELQRKLSVDKDCRDLCEYLEKFDFPLSLLQSKDAISEAVYMLCEELLGKGLAYAEIRFAPQLHCDRGLSQEEVVEAAIFGMKRSSMFATLILCCMRGEGLYEKNILTLNVAKTFLGQGVGAVDLAGAESLYPNEKFADVFAYAKENGIPFTIHAGEADGALSVRSAIDMGACRIGHGVRSFEDKELLCEIAERGIALELCPTSNLNTKVFDSIEDYPIENFLLADVPITINTDNMSVSNTTLADEFEKLASVYEFSKEEFEKIVRTAVNVSFADLATKEKVLARIEEKFKI